MAKLTLDWTDMPGPVSPGEPLTRAEHQLMNPFVQGATSPVKITVSDFADMEHPEGNPYRLLIIHARFEGAAMQFHSSVERAKQAAATLLEDLAEDWTNTLEGR